MNANTNTPRPVKYDSYAPANCDVEYDPTDLELGNVWMYFEEMMDEAVEEGDAHTAAYYFSQLQDLVMHDGDVRHLSKRQQQILREYAIDVTSPSVVELPTVADIPSFG